LGEADLWFCPRNLLDCGCEVPIWFADAESAKSKGHGTRQTVSAREGGDHSVSVATFWDDWMKAALFLIMELQQSIRK